MNQVGVWLLENSDAISLAAAAELVRASWTREEGRAVWRTEKRDKLNDCQLCAGLRLCSCTYRSSVGEADAWGAAKAEAAKAEMARMVNCILAMRLSECVKLCELQW